MNPLRNKQSMPAGLPQPFKPGPRVPSMKPLRPMPGVLQPKMTSTPHSHNKPAPAASLIRSVIQCATPAGARGKVSYYKIAGRDRATDGINYWYKNHRGGWTRIRKGKVPSYNRFQPTKSGKGAPRKASLAVREGSAASYAQGLRIRVKQDRIVAAQVREVVAATRSKRAYSQNMLAATTLEGEIATNSATIYAAHFGAPVIPGGYNWCHLIGHGAGGSDQAANIMSASTHCNSEQLQIEKVVYQYKSQGVAISCDAEKYRHAFYLASKITYHVWVKGKKVYTREMNGFRAAKPTYSELEAVRENLTKRITAALQ